MNFKKLALIAAVPVLFGGWALFRPELLFVDSKVSERAPQGMTRQLAAGNFSSDAHETVGTASLIEVDGKPLLRLSSFRTSNGPDVHVLLVQGPDASRGDAVKSSKTIDLGVIKGNIGDQNYAIPSDVDLDRIGAVSIWCKRFGVNFGGASLTRTTPSAQSGTVTLAGFAPDTKVTSGAFVSDAHQTVGKATIYEMKGGKRRLELTGFKTAEGPALRVLLVKAETVEGAKTIKNAKTIDLGPLKNSQGKQTFAVPADIDLWQFRSVSIWCAKFKVNFGAAALRSDQERSGS